MPKRIRIDAMTLTTTNSTLITAFSPYGTIVSMAIILDGSGASTGAADGEYTTEAEGTAAINAMDGAVLDGATIRVTEAT